jgi:hypothetical protein
LAGELYEFGAKVHGARAVEEGPRWHCGHERDFRASDLLNAPCM